MQVQTQVSHPVSTGLAEPRRRAVAALVVSVMGLAALAVVLPFLFKGDISGHDFEFHIASWMEVARQWHDGIWYPRWAALANFGYGEPRFIFYPPESWILGAALSQVLPWGMVPGAYIWLMLTLAGVAMYQLARQWLSPRDAAAAGVLFAVNPYHLVLVYWRSDFAEMIASAIFPLLLLVLLKLARQPRPAIVPLALLIAASWLANAPAGVIVSYAVALLLVVLALRERSWRVLFYGAGAMALGIALASFYLLPAAYEQPWVDIGQALAAGLRPNDSFLFTVAPDPEHTRFNFLVSKVAVGELVALALAILLTLRLRREHPRLWWTMLALAAACALLMVRITLPLWTYLPKLRFVQFPWRWLFPLGAPFAGFAATALSRCRWRLRLVLWIVCAAALATSAWALTRDAWWDKAGVKELRQAILERGSGYEGAWEYATEGADLEDLVKSAPLIAEAQRPNEAASALPRYAPAFRIFAWYPERKLFQVTVGAPTGLILRLLNYPAWHVTVNGREERAGSSKGTGQMLISVPTGTSRVEITFRRTPDRLWGGVLSLVAVAVFLAFLWIVHGRRGPRQWTTASESPPSR